MGFKLSESFVNLYKDREPEWGPLGEFTFLRCVTEETPVLCADFRWRPAGSLKVGDELIAFSEEKVTGKTRHLCRSVVSANTIEKASVMGIELKNGKILYATPEHRWLVKKSPSSHNIEWVYTKDLVSSGDRTPKLMPIWSEVWEEDTSYEAGYLAAAFDGEGSLDRTSGLCFVQTENEMLIKVEECLQKLGIKYSKHSKPPSTSANSFKSNKPTWKISIYGKRNLMEFIGKVRPQRFIRLMLDNIIKDKVTLFHTEFSEIVRVWDAGEKNIAVLSTSSKTHITDGVPSHNTYSRKVEGENRNEMWWETVRRVVEGVYNVQKNHCDTLKLAWNSAKSHRSAEKMYDKIFNFKFLPPGRGLWMMGTDFVKEKGSAALNNCAFVSSEDIDTRGSFMFTWTMDALMLGVGVGFDTKGAGRITIKQPKPDGVFVIPDQREGWVESLGLLLDAYFSGKQLPTFDYSLIRPYGSPIRGFGGVASGPEPLEKMHKNINALLAKRIGEKLGSTDIVDIVNMISACVVAGNVRRCLPEGSLLHTSGGMKPIENARVGDTVLTHDGYKKITNVFDQGEQTTIVLVTQDGAFEATPNHRMAILDGVDSFKWVEAKDIRPSDRLITTREELPGKETRLPSWSYDKPEHSTTCLDITIPALDMDMAWFLGALHANGYVYYREDLNGANSYISLVYALDKKLLAERSMKQLSRFGVSVKMMKRKDENSYVVQCQSKQLAMYLSQHIKTPHTALKIPQFIWEAQPETRLAYVAGVMDCDGSIKTRPVQVVSTVYETFALELQQLLYSCGVISRMNYSLTAAPSRVAKGWKPLFRLSLINPSGLRKMHDCPQLIRKPKIDKAARKANTYPSEWISCMESIGSAKTRMGAFSNARIPVETFEKHVRPVQYVPCEVVGIEKGRCIQTYDIEVEDNHNFFCNGYLTHNSACIAVGDATDKAYVTMKDYNLYPEEVASHRWASNNSIFAEVGKTDYNTVVDSIILNGEPGIVWLENLRKYSRTKDAPDWKDAEAVGVNPCSEQTLENAELCCLVETFPSRHESYSEYRETLKYAYLYGKSVTLLATHWPETNAVLLKNRRIGVSQSGIQDAFVKHGRREMLRWCDEGYNYITELDKVYSNWLCIPRSKKMTSVKPSGSVSLLPGVSPGIHFPHSEYYIRRVRVAKSNPIVQIMFAAGYEIEASETDANTMIVRFPVHESLFSKRKEDVTIWQQVKDVVDYQRFWADNNVSVTVTFKPHEREDIVRVLEAYEDSLKAISFLPLTDHGYAQAPYEEITKEQYEAMASKLTKPYFAEITNTPLGSKFCDGDSCVI